MAVTLGEGNTPLLQAPRLSERLGCELWLKWEGANPTGSFKDRGMTLAVSRAVERGAPGVVCASTGNTAASAAAYAARAGLPAVIVLPQGAVARGKLAQVPLPAPSCVVTGRSICTGRAAAPDEEGLVNVNSINQTGSRARPRARGSSSSWGPPDARAPTAAAETRRVRGRRGGRGSPRSRSSLRSVPTRS